MYQTIRGWITRAGLTNRAEVAGRDDWMVDVDGPMLSDEVDEQAWQADRIRTRPQGEMRQPAASPAWKPDDYAEMAFGKGAALWISDGGPAVSEEQARARLREAMSYMSAPVTVSARPDPWDLRGDRVVAPVEPDPDGGEEIPLEVRPVGEVALDALVARELGTVPALLAVSDANIAAARSLLAESDAQLGRALETEEGRLAMARAAMSGRHLGASDSTAGNSRKGVQAAGKPTGVTDMDDGEEEDEKPAKPLVWKKAEPPARFHRDEWGFPIPPPADDRAGSEPPPPAEEPEAEEEPAASPPPDQLGTGGSAGAASPASGSSHYQSVDPALRAATIEEKGMKTRVQLTGYQAGQYVRGEADNFVVPDIMAEAVREALQPIADLARERHGAAVGAGAAKSKGGWRVRIQLTEYADNGGQYLRQDGSAAKPQNLNVPAMRVAEVAALVDHQLALHFGVRRGDAAALVAAWRGFAGTEPRAPEAAAPAAATGEPLALLLPDLVGKGYDKRLHIGLCAVVEGKSLRVISLWEREADAVLAARRVGARVVDAEGYLVPEEEVAGAPQAAPDPGEARL